MSSKIERGENERGRRSDTKRDGPADAIATHCLLLQ